jgi:ferredoxin
MKFFVNEDCIACGLCESTCPEVFEIKDDGFAHAIDEDVADENVEDAKMAMEGCPVNAIEEK